jgi:DNA recombination protein RmuC
MTFVVIILAILVVVMAILLFRNQGSSGGSSTVMLKQDIDQLNQSVNKLNEGLQNKLTERLDKNQQMMLGSIQKQFSESSKIISEVTKNLTELKEANKQVMGVTDELKVLQNVLSNPKQRGVLGEYQLNQLLENVLPPEQIQATISIQKR